MTDAAWMRRALTLAGAAVGNTAPNPPVGAVIAGPDGEVLGEGWTRPAGQDHAEVAALKDCAARGHDPRGATLYATLEPCRHHGRTPPCTEAIVAAGITRVVVGVRDPFPPMRGQGIAALRAAGVQVDEGVEAEACARRILGFARVVSVGLPEVTLKAATSLDGRIATAGGESKWITSEAAREAGRRLRATHDAVLVGIGTALADDPALTTRIAGARDAVPVVLDTHGRLPLDAKLLRSSRRALVVVGPSAPTSALEGVADVVRVPLGPDGRAELRAALAALAARGLHRVLVEGGGTVVRSVVEQGLADTLELFLAPVLVPGGVPMLGGPPLAALADAPRLAFDTVATIGPDLWVRYRLTHAVAPDPLADLRA